MPNPSVTVTFEGFATKDDIAEIRRENGELRKLVEELKKLVVPSDAMMDRLATAEWLGVSPSTLDGIDDLPRTKIGTRNLWDPEDLRAWRRKHKALPGPRASAEAA